MHDSQAHGRVWTSLEESTIFLRQQRPALAPRVGVVLGSGLGAFADTLGDLKKIPYASIPNFSASTVAGHSGHLCFGTAASGVSVVCMQGRVHGYEGHSVDRVVHGVRTMAKLGVCAVLLTNAAGGLESSWLPGDLMVIEDHINLTGSSPLTGLNDERLGARFPDMTRAYDRELNAQLLQVARKHGIELRSGVYAGLPGPSYETPAEVRMLRAFGAHAVGMSTVHEVLALRHMKVRVGALSCITNLAAGILDRELNHAEVEEAAKAKRTALITLLEGWIALAGVSS